MLYLTTRSNRDAYTAHRAIMAEHGPDGGLYIPFTLPEYSAEEIAALKEKSFSQTVADVLNTFFSSRLSSWDVDFCIGRNPMRLEQIGRKVTVAELWHNPAGNYEYLIKALASKICGDKDIPSNWQKIAVEIAMLFGIYGEMLKSEVIEIRKTFDISVQLGDFSAPIAAVYAKKLGIPIDTVICNSIDNSAVWDFLHKGIFNPAGTDTALQEGLERLICDTLGHEQTMRFVSSCKERKSYSVTDEQLPVLNRGFFVSVAGENRGLTTINSIYRTNSYVIDPHTAVCFGGIQDYRSKAGESKLTLLMSKESPLHFAGDIMGTTGLKKEKLEEIVNS